jgi:thiol-disulfide isomerase/thioredoxin
MLRICRYVFGAIVTAGCDLGGNSMRADPVNKLLAIVAVTTALQCRQSVEAAAAGDGGGAIEVRIVDGAGAPQAGASMSLFRFDRDWRYWKKFDVDAASAGSASVRYESLPVEESSSYAVRATTDGGGVAYRECMLSADDLHEEVTLQIEPSLVTRVKVEDEGGGPIAGATIWSLRYTGKNGTIKLLDFQSLESFGLATAASDASGELVLPRLPGGNVDVVITHPDYAPNELKRLEVGGAPAAQIKMERGVKLKLQLSSRGEKLPIDSALLDFRHEPFEHPSTLIGRLPRLDQAGGWELTVAAGKYQFLRLMHPDYLLTPIYAEKSGHGPGDPLEPFKLVPGENVFTVQVAPKVKVHGRVIQESNGEPMADAGMEGSVHCDAVSGVNGRFTEEWTHADWADANASGEYEMALAAGRARVTFQEQGWLARPDHYDVDVAADGSTVVPDFVAARLPKVRGVVVDESGQPVPKAVVRFRGSMLTYAVEPVAADDEGRFELAPTFVPEDWETHAPLPTQIVVALDPYGAAAGRTDVQLDEPKSLENVVVRLRPQPLSSAVDAITSDLWPRDRGIVEADKQQRPDGGSLVGKAAPELDGSQWLNTENPKMSLTDFRGKYVLLQFWTTWCGPCHQDMPSVKLVRELYGDRGFEVIGVHDNSMPVEAIKEDVAKMKLKYPIVVDQSDGRILASYSGHGVSGYPSYVLIGPDGLVARDSDTPGPQLRSFKIELVREITLTK